MSHQHTRTLVTGLALVAGVTLVVGGCNKSDSDNSATSLALANQQQQQQALLTQQAQWAAGESGSYTGSYAVTSSVGSNGSPASALGCVTGVNLFEILSSSTATAASGATVNFTLTYTRVGDNYTKVLYNDDYGLSGTGTGKLTQSGDFAVAITITKDADNSSGSINLAGKFASARPGAGKDMGSISVNAAIQSANAIKKLIGTGLGSLKVPATVDPLAAVLGYTGDPSTDPYLNMFKQPTPVTTTFSQASRSYTGGAWSAWSTAISNSSTFSSGVSSYVIPVGYTASQPNSIYSPNDIYAGKTVAKITTTGSSMPGYTSVSSSYMTKGTDGRWYQLGYASQTYTAGGPSGSPMYGWSVPPMASQNTPTKPGETMTFSTSTLPVAGGSPGYINSMSWTLLEANGSATFPAGDFNLPAEAPTLNNPCYKNVTRMIQEMITIYKAADGTETRTTSKWDFKGTSYMNSAPTSSGNPYGQVTNISEAENYDEKGNVTNKSQSWTKTN